MLTAVNFKCSLKLLMKAKPKEEKSVGRTAEQVWWWTLGKKLIFTICTTGHIPFPTALFSTLQFSIQIGALSSIISTRLFPQLSYHFSCSVLLWEQFKCFYNGAENSEVCWDYTCRLPATAVNRLARLTRHRLGLCPVFSVNIWTQYMWV